MRFTFFKISAFILAGILLGRLFSIQVNWAVSVFGVLLILNLFISPYRRWKIILLLIAAGYSHYQSIAHKDRHHWKGEYFKVELIKPDGFRRYTAQVEAIYSSGRWKRSGEIVLIQGLDKGLEEGSTLMVTGDASRLKDDNWRIYYESKHIYRQIAVRVANEINEDKSFIHRSKLWLLQRLGEVVPEPDENSLIQGVLLGNKSGLSLDIKNHFQHIGGMHLLAVSGLHVSLLYIFIKLILLPLPGYRFFRILSFIVTVSILWFYAALTGYGASVNRAALFFTIFSLSNLLARKSQLVHVLPLTACLTWAIDPFQVFTVSFQLSYLAVLGIMFFQPRFEKMTHRLGPIGKYLFNLMTISVAAQSLTWPLILYYFNGLPAFSIFYNILLLPAATLIMYVSIPAIILYDIPFLGILLSRVLRVLLGEVLRFSAVGSEYAFVWTPGEIMIIVLVSLAVISCFLLLKFTSRLTLLTFISLAAAVSLYPFIRNGNVEKIVLTQDKNDPVIVWGAHKTVSKYPMQLFKLYGYRIFITKATVPPAVKTDIIVVNGPVIPDHLEAGSTIVLSKGLSYNTKNKWKVFAREQGLELHDLREKDLVLTIKKDGI